MVRSQALHLRNYLQGRLFPAWKQPVMILAAHNLYLTYVAVLMSLSCVLSRVWQKHWQPFVNQRECGRLHRDGQSRDIAGARSGPAHSVLQPQGEPGDPPHQSLRHSLHSAPPKVGTLSCEYTRTKKVKLVKTNLFTLPYLGFPAGLMTTHQRVSTTGLSWPLTPGMRAPLARGCWRSRTWLVPVITVKPLRGWIFLHVSVLLTRI